MRPSVFMTSHFISQTVCQGFCSGMRIGSDGDPVVLYGILRGCEEVMRACERDGRDYYHIDHGYFGRGHFNGYYRITKNGLRYRWNGEDFPSDRWERLKIRVHPWKRGSKVMICPPTPAIARFYGIDSLQWLHDTMETLSGHTDRDFIVRQKGASEKFSEQVKDCWAVVAHTSNIAVDALVRGVPSFVDGDDLSKIESPETIDREGYFRALAYNQWKFGEWNL